MKKYWSLIIGVVWLAAGIVQAAPLDPGLVAKIHFAGGDAVAADPNALPLRNLWSGPEGLALRAQTLDKLSRFLDGWLRQAVAPNLVPAWQTRPLLADLCLAEWQLEVRQPAPGAVDFSLAVRLGENRAQAWQMALNPVLTGWKQSSPAHHGYVTVKDGWLFFALYNAPAPAAAGAIASLNHSWLTAEVDWARLAVWFPAVAKFDIPQTRLEVTGKNGQFEATGRLYLAQPLPPLQPWQVPTNIFHPPFLSFTAARGISDWLRQQPWAVTLGITPLPDQVFSWVLPQVPFLTFAAAPVANAPAALPKVANRVSDALLARSQDENYRNVHIESTPNQILLVGLPLMAPFVEARKEADGQFLVAGFLPVIPRGKPVPPELLARLNQPNLVFYHWEITADRLAVFPQLYQLIFLVTGHCQLDDGTPGYNWLEHPGVKLGPTITTATEVSPTELSFSRQAPAGLTALELVALTSWLEGPDFPGGDLRVPPRKKIFNHHPHPPMTGAPAPAVQHP